MHVDVDLDAVQLWGRSGYTNLANYAWYGANSGGTTHPWAEAAESVDFMIPTGTCLSGAILVRHLRRRMTLDPRVHWREQRVIRGGDWYSPGNDPGDCRSALRVSYYPANREQWRGLPHCLEPK